MHTANNNTHTHKGSRWQKQSHTRPKLYLGVEKKDHQQHQSSLDNTRTTRKVLQKWRLQEGNDAQAPSSPDPTIECQIMSFHPEDYVRVNFKQCLQKGNDAKHRHCQVQPTKVRHREFTPKLEIRYLKCTTNRSHHVLPPPLSAIPTASHIEVRSLTREEGHQHGQNPRSGRFGSLAPSSKWMPVANLKWHHHALLLWRPHQ